jgi:PAT family beta-lactamase induction signal transducer AmpG
VATATIGNAAAIAGTFLGGLLTQSLGLGRALWIFGFLQMVSNLGYAVVAQVGVNRPVMYSAQAFELGSTGLGSGAFGVLLLRLTQKRFSATQYALLSSLFTLPRILAGPIAGVAADALGWRDFFVLTVFTGIPGMMMLARFVPWGLREPVFEVAAPPGARP